jgi:uncharacterized protein (TIGR00661 family)
MAKPVLIYAAQGDGRAHAVRALAVAQALSEYEVHILSSGQGYDFLKRTGYGHIHEIDGLSAVRGKGGRIDYLRTAWKVVQFFFGLPASIDEVHQRFAALKPEAVIADFEPSVSRWARREGIPYLRLDSQGRFDTFAPPSSLPLALRVYWYAAGLFTRLWMPLSDHKVISVFNHERLHTQDERTSVVNCFLRPELLDAVTKAGEHILVYAKEGMEKALCQSLAEVSGPIRCYGFQPPEDDKRFEKCAISQDAFLEDLLAARLVIYSVGNQLTAEVHAAGKPAIAVPEPLQWEQVINAILCEQEGWAKYCPLSKLSPGVIAEALERPIASDLPQSGVEDGVQAAASIIRAKVLQAKYCPLEESGTAKLVTQLERLIPL